MRHVANIFILDLEFVLDGQIIGTLINSRESYLVVENTIVDEIKILMTVIYFRSFYFKPKI